MLSLLIFIGEAVRDAFDPRKTFSGADRMDAINQPLLDVRDLSVAFGKTARRGGRACSFSIKRGRDAWRWSANPARARSVTALSILKLLPYPAACASVRHHPFQGHASCSAPANASCARCAATTSR